MAKNKLTIAIDGFSSCGKSTLAYELAQCLSYAYIDSGAMYRAFTLYILENNLDYNKTEDIKLAISKVNIRFNNNHGRMETILNGDNIEDAIRKQRISNHVSEVARISEVRTFLVKQQQEMGKQGGIVMDGRDIGTVVFPEADIKFFVTADPEVRIDRRHKELIARGQDTSLEEVAENLAKRDRIDSTRKDSPLKKAEDAITVDNSRLSKKEQLTEVVDHVISKYPTINVSSQCTE